MELQNMKYTFRDDYYSGMKDAYYYLTSLGHEKIAYISGTPPLHQANTAGRRDWMRSDGAAIILEESIMMTILF